MTEPVTPPATPPTTPPASNSPTPPSNDPKVDPIALAKENGELKAKVEEYEKYKTQVDPVLETLNWDKELLDKAIESHNKRLGKITTPKPPSTPPGDTPPKKPDDTRAALVERTYTEFEQKVGIDKLGEEDKKKVRGQVGQMLKDLLDPNNNKTINQVLEDVSLVKLPFYLEKAHQLINRDNDLKKANEQGKNEVLSQYTDQAGNIGSLAGGSVPIDEVTLTPKERQAAANMGVSEEDYLKNKKEILQARNS